MAVHHAMCRRRPRGGRRAAGAPLPAAPPGPVAAVPAPPLGPVPDVHAPPPGPVIVVPAASCRSPCYSPNTAVLTHRMHM
ncbi:hypothetical protein TSUD_248660 [Trifolium subterraneum]|uniref:Uncharacterized protein n=1 Tax=Trifolium subterraneum TaxID=3900 RepID=A0A2Z6MPG7_TRISU|nr:hypothetical protein TSUD_248660 [Trifolium subterraneum]